MMVRCGGLSRVGRRTLAKEEDAGPTGPAGPAARGAAFCRCGQTLDRSATVADIM